MPIIVACTKCTRQLRVADELIGRKVRCPACDHTFDAVAAPAAPPEPVPIEPWQSLDLELSEPKPEGKKEAPGGSPREVDLDLNLNAPPDKPAAKKGADKPIETVPIEPWRPPQMELGPPEKPAERPSPIGAVEVGTDRDEPADKRSPPPREGERGRDREREERRPRPRLSNDHDDLRACPGCGRMTHRDSRRCPVCRYRLRDEDDPDRDEDDRRPVRRDCEPHRGTMILMFGIIAIASLFTCQGLLAPVAIILGLCAWIMGSSDLRKMRAGTMDPSGHGMTNAGWICGIVGTVLNILAVLACGGFIGLMIYSDTQRARRMNQQKFRAVPPRAPQPPGWK